MDKKKLQKLMVERRQNRKLKHEIKIDSPLAKYNNAGQLTCALCFSVVKSEHVWPVHINSMQHRENVRLAKELKSSTDNFTAPIKHTKPIKINEGPPAKKLKGILKNSTPVCPAPPASSSQTSTAPTLEVGNGVYHNEEIKRAPLNMTLLVSQSEVKRDSSKGENKPKIETVIEPQESNGADPTTEPQAPIPEGFFDDPVLDAKVRNIEYRDPHEEEWEKFMKEMKEEQTASAEIIADEQIEATVERQIDEIDEQMRNWNRVLSLEVKKEETQKKTQETEQMEDDTNNSDDEEDIEEFLDWRAKRS